MGVANLKVLADRPRKPPHIIIIHRGRVESGETVNYEDMFENYCPYNHIPRCS